MELNAFGNDIFVSHRNVIRTKEHRAACVY